jgi:SNF2 family DNA or RNA helicase
VVDPSRHFRIVYSLFLHEAFGYIITIHAVEQNEQGNITLKHQRISQELLQRFVHRFDDIDRTLFDILDSISLHSLFQQFGHHMASIQEFSSRFVQVASDETREYVLQYIDKRKQDALTIIEQHQKPLYLMSRDGYPAWKPVKFVAEPLKVNFDYKRDAHQTHYSVVLYQNGQVLELVNNTTKTSILVNKPVRLLRNAEILSIESDLDSKKLRPFTQKKTLTIPARNEEEHFRKFLLPLLEKHTVQAEGFEIIEIAPIPAFYLELKHDAQQFVHFRLLVEYDKHRFSPEHKSTYKAFLEILPETAEPTGRGYRFIRIVRDLEREAVVVNAYMALRDQNHSLFDLILKEGDAFVWLQQHYATLMSLGVELLQTAETGRFNLNQPSIDYRVEQKAEGFYVKADLLIGTERFPFSDVQKHLVKGQLKFMLPDKSYVLLPQQWEADFRHFFEVARDTPDGYLLQPYQAPLLQQIFQKDFQWQALRAFQEIEKQPVPQSLQADLREYQAAGYDWLCFLRDHGLNGILADDMGLGKTLQTLTLLLAEHEHGKDRPSLVIVPTSLLFNWVDEARKFAPRLKLLLYSGTKREAKRAEIPKHDVVITSYGLIRQDEEHFKNLVFHYIVLDESHLIKNSDAKTTRCIFHLVARHRLSLTGTPIENGTTDLWTQMHFLNPGLLGGSTFFEKYYAQPIEREGNQSRAEKLRQLVHPFILRRTKEMVASELPERVEQVSYCEMTESQRKLYNETRNLCRSTLFKDADDFSQSTGANAVQLLTYLQRLRQIAIHPQMIDPEGGTSGKYEEVLQMLDDILQQGSKVIVFSQYVRFLSIIKFDLMKRKVRFSYLDGTTKNRKEEVEKFQAGHTDVFLLSLKAGGVGLNLTRGEYVFIVDPWWNPAIEQQAIARAHRIGQNKTVFAYKFITRNSIEERILTLQQRKSQLAQDLIKTEEQFFKSLTREDFASLLD